jgi:GNAT superfamily N-acetyltransferase
MRVHELTSPGEKSRALYSEVLDPSFPPDELHTLETLHGAMEAGTGPIWIAEDDEGRILGGAVGEWDAGSRIVLLSYLAVRPGIRGGGVGGSLLRAALDAWRSRLSPCMILAEVEDPAHYRGGGAHGDPAARWRFYQRHRGRALDLPYFQAALRPGTARVPHLMLVVLHADPKFSGAGPDTIDPASLRAYLEDYQRQCEGAVGTDPQAMALWQALDRPGGVPFLPATGD